MPNVEKMNMGTRTLIDSRITKSEKKQNKNKA